MKKFITGIVIWPHTAQKAKTLCIDTRYIDDHNELQTGWVPPITFENLEDYVRSVILTYYDFREADIKEAELRADNGKLATELRRIADHFDPPAACPKCGGTGKEVLFNTPSPCSACKLEA